MKQRKYVLFLLILSAFFLAYNFNIYTGKEDYGDIRLSEKALQGQNLWLKNNCNSCHQIYGLGGYLGPDLTNVYSFRKGDDTYLKAMFNSGIKSMPLFHFNESQQEELLQFLKEMDQTGLSPNIETEIKPNGWISIKPKKMDYE